MATELATAYLSLIPTLKGAGNERELDGVNIDPRVWQEDGQAAR